MLFTLLHDILIQLFTTSFYINRKLINNIAINAIIESKHLSHYCLIKKLKNLTN